MYPLAWLGAVVIAGGLLGCGGDDDDDDAGDNGGDGGGAASISGVIPGDVFVGRDADVLIIGSNTEWADGVSVGLGDGVTVNGVSVASPTALLVNVTASADAALGTRDVTVGDLSFAAGFELVSPIRVTVQGVIAQGSISVLKVQNLDFANPFDTTSIGDGFFEPLQFINVQATAGTGSAADVSLVEAYNMELLLLTDVNAAGGSQTLDILSGPTGQELSFRFPAAFDVIEREPMPLTAGELATGSIDEPFEALVYSITPEDLSIVTTETFAESPDAAPAMAILPASGSFADIVAFDFGATIVTDEVHYLVYWDNTGASGYNFQIGANANVVASALVEAEPNNARPEAAVVDGTPGVVDASTLSGQDDEDWVQVELSAEDVGAGVSLHALTYGADTLTDTVVAVFQGNGATPIAESSDLGYLDEVSAFIDEPGTYYVQVTASPPPFFDPAHNAYGVAVVLE